MRIECEQCRALVEPTWSVNGAELVARCPTCSGDSRATVASASATAKPAFPAADGPECPKCGLSPVTGDACARCGLAVERMESWAASEDPSDALVAAWETCRARWDDPATHDRVASLALTLGEQPWVARQYRAILRERPGDEIAADRLARTGKIAQAAILASSSQPRPGGYRRGSFAGILLVLALVVAGGLLWGLYMARERESTTPSSTTPAKRAPTGVYKHPPSGSAPGRTPTSR